MTDAVDRATSMIADVLRRRYSRSGGRVPAGFWVDVKEGNKCILVDLRYAFGLGTGIRCGSDTVAITEDELAKMTEPNPGETLAAMVERIDEALTELMRESIPDLETST